MRPKVRGILSIHFAVFLFGLSGVFGKFLEFSPIIIVFGRMLFSSAALGLMLLSLRRFVWIRNKTQLFVFILLGITLAIHWVTFFHSIQISTVAVGLLTFSTFPIFVTVIEPLFFKKRLRLFDLLTAGIAFFGVFFVIPSFDWRNQILRGALWGIFSGFLFALLTILNRRYVKTFHSSIIAFYQNMFGWIILLPFTFTISFSSSLKQLLFIAFLGVVCTALSHALFIGGLKHVRAHLASVIACLEPVYGIIFAVLFIQEIPSLKTIFGGLIILGAIFMATLREKDHHQ